MNLPFLITLLRGLFLASGAVCLFFACQNPQPSSTSSSHSPAIPPNIVLIITDDQGIGDFGVHGNPVIHTPNIDRLAGESASVERFYVSPVCAPTRANLMTGRYNYRTRAIDTYVGRAMLEPEETTLAELLGSAGYATGIFGKWHLGDSYPMRPQDQGFQEVLVHKGGGLAQPADPLANERRYTDPILFHNGEEKHMQGYCTDIYFDHALAFIESQARAGKPFFTYLATNAPHGPYHDVPEDLYQQYLEKDLSKVIRTANPEDSSEVDRVARIFAMIENIDQNIGRLLETLDAQGLSDNTLVVFMVDNGPNTRRYVMDLRGMKSEVHEGGIRSPLWIRWPERLEAGTQVRQIAAHIDLFPTLAAAAGVSLPDNLDGRNLLPLLEDPTSPWEPRSLFIQSHRGDAPIRQHHIAVIQQAWKLVHPTGFGNLEMRQGVPFELYKIDEDPGERENLVESHPEKVNELFHQYNTWFADVSATRPDNYAKPYIIAGHPAEPRTVLTKQDWERTAGGGWGDQGQWYIDIAVPASFEITCLLTEPLSGGTATLEVAGESWQQDISAGSVEIVFSEIRLPAGKTTLVATLDDGSASRGPYQVFLQKNP